MFYKKLFLWKNPAVDLNWVEKSQNWSCFSSIAWIISLKMLFKLFTTKNLCNKDRLMDVVQKFDLWHLKWDLFYLFFKETDFLAGLFNKQNEWQSLIFPLLLFKSHQSNTKQVTMEQNSRMKLLEFNTSYLYLLSLPEKGEL